MKQDMVQIVNFNYYAIFINFKTIKLITEIEWISIPFCINGEVNINENGKLDYISRNQK